MEVGLDNPKTDPALWQRLKGYAFAFSDGGFLVDAVRDETGLTVSEAECAVAEYRRFLYLIATADQILAPSRLVDKVWHLHLEDDKGYSDELCKQTVGRQINHHVGRPAPFDDPAYAKTLAFYRAEFGEYPFWKVWPTPDREGPFKVAALLAVAFFAGGVGAFVNSLPILGVVMICLAVGAAVQVARLSPWSSNTGSSSGCGSGTSDSNGDGDGGDGGDGGGCGGD